MRINGEALGCGWQGGISAGAESQLVMDGSVWEQGKSGRACGQSGLPSGSARWAGQS